MQARLSWRTFYKENYTFDRLIRLSCNQKEELILDQAFLFCSDHDPVN